MRKSKVTIWVLTFAWLLVGGITWALAQEGELEFTIDVNSNTVPLPKILRPNIDLSGRGSNRDNVWPQGVADKVTLETWQKDIGFGGIYRLQYNLWEINELAKNKEAQQQLLNNYESIIKAVNDAQGVVILDIFSTPAGLGKALDKKSAPWDFKAFKELVKQTVRNLSCEKKYNIWYEVWTAPDMEDFYVGKKQEYFNLYRAVAEAVTELKTEYKLHIPVGGPSTSWWFQNLDGNSVVTPERSLIYELIKFCYNSRLPLDFITWHSYSTDPRIDTEITTYRKTAVALIRDWLSYFHFDSGTALIVDEWNYDSGANMLPERQEKSYIAASYVVSRIKAMYEAGLDAQVYYSLEDFRNNKEGVARNVGAFWFDKDDPESKRGPKSIYNAFRMLSLLYKDMFVSSQKSNDEFADMIATKNNDQFAVIIYNYCDPALAMNYVFRNIASLNEAERKAVLGLIKSGKLEKIIRDGLDVTKLRLTKRAKSLLKKAQGLNELAVKYANSPRNIKINIKNIKDDYNYQRYTLDSSCSLNCEFVPVEDKQLSGADSYQKNLSLSPYSVNMIILKK
ncbi:MAG: GH39 family glycosyl hydrolase, partial [Deltaproteobacteria bacterium]